MKITVDVDTDSLGELSFSKRVHTNSQTVREDLGSLLDDSVNRVRAAYGLAVVPEPVEVTGLREYLTRAAKVYGAHNIEGRVSTETVLGILDGKFSAAEAIAKDML